MPKHGLLINYYWCTGCHTCEVACKQEHNLPAGKWGIRVIEVGPELTGGKLILNIPVPTELCDLCEQRVKEGELPACVKHCQARTMTYGTIEELTKKIDSPYTLLWLPK
jgi:Fe-S-cluster-containing dehydrogenase component